MQIIWIILSFFIGAIPCGLLITQKYCNIDPRNDGSCNVGSTNVARLCGKKYGIYTLACDIAKGFFPVAIGSCIISSDMLFLSCTGLATVLGHAFSPFLNFRGGKAVATSIGVFIFMAFWPILLSAIACLACIKYSKFVSLGSLVLVISLPIFLLLGGYWSTLPLALSTMILVIWTHRYNIQRLICGIENPWLPSADKE